MYKQLFLLSLNELSTKIELFKTVNTKFWCVKEEAVITKQVCSNKFDGVLKFAQSLKVMSK